jgi:hypothetical protein
MVSTMDTDTMDMTGTLDRTSRMDTGSSAMGDIKGMSSRKLVERLAEQEDMDDVIEAELHRRSLSKLNMMTWASFAMMGSALIGLTLSGLYLTGVLKRPQPSPVESVDVYSCG